MSEYGVFCNGEGRLDEPAPSLNRRQVLRAGLLGAVWWAGAGALAQTTFRTPQAHDNVLVVVFLRGGADGLNIVAPYGDDGYYRARPNLGIKAPTTTGPENEKLADLDGFFGLNPALRPLLPAYEAGDMGFVHAVGSGDDTRSHFSAMATMERGQESVTGEGKGGWLARHLNAIDRPGAPMRALAIGSVLPDSLRGATRAVAVNSLADYKLTGGERMREALQKLYHGKDDEYAHAGRETLRLLETLQQSDPTSYQPENNAEYPESKTGEGLKQVAYLVKRGLGLEVACVDSTGLQEIGWDTHVGQGTTGGWLTSLLDDLGRSLAAFRADLGSEMKRVTVVVQTEFGRRVAENSGLGTDHGRGGVMFLMGGGVQGGRVVTEWPTLDRGAQAGPGDVPVTTDYRHVLGEVLANRLGNDQLGEVFPGLSPRPMGLVRA